MSLRTVVAYGILVWLTMWPISHMALSRALGFSTWRFGGWGMYATPAPAQTWVKVILLNDGAPTPSHLTLDGLRDGPQRGLRLEVDSQVNGKPLPIDLSTISGARRRELRRALDAVKHLRQGSHVEALASTLQKTAVPEGTIESAIVLIVYRRVDLFKARSYVETEAFVVRGGRAQKVGRFRTDATSISEILEACNRVRRAR